MTYEPTPADIARRILRINDPIHPAYYHEAKIGFQAYGDAIATDAVAIAQAVLDAEAEKEQILKAYVRGVEKSNERFFALEAAEARLAKAADIIQGLRDIQKGCPLGTWREEFDTINAEADAFLAEQEKTE